METQQAEIWQPRQGEDRMGLLGILFFMMGALHIYGQVRAQGQKVNSITRLAGNHLWKIGLMGAIVGSILELVIN
jgi:hypothetical protein